MKGIKAYNIKYVEHLMYDTDTDDNQHFLFNFIFYLICKQKKCLKSRGKLKITNVHFQSSNPTDRVI